MALGAASLAMLAGPACRERARKPAKVPFATQVAYGRPDTCPEDAVDPYGDGTPGPMDLRCSYSDGTGSILTRVRGRVQVEGPPGTSGGSPGRVRVALHRAPKAPGEGLGRELAHGFTEPQGTFTLGAMLRPGEMVLLVTDPDDGALLVQQRVTVGGEAGHRLDVRIVIPRPLDAPEPPADEPTLPTPPGPAPTP
jgi:hypothetical protein